MGTVELPFNKVPINDFSTENLIKVILQFCDILHFDIFKSVAQAYDRANDCSCLWDLI